MRWSPCCPCRPRAARQPQYRSAAPASSFAAQWRAREFGAPAPPARNPSPAPSRLPHRPLPAAAPARPAWGRTAPLPKPAAAAPLAASTKSAAPTGTRAPLTDAQLAAGAAFAAATPLLTSAYAGIKTFSSTLPVAKRLLTAGAGAMLSGVLPSGGAPVVAAPCADDDAAPPSGPATGRRSLRHQVTHGVAHLSGGVLSANGVVARAAGSAAEAGAAAAVGLAVNDAAVGCAATAAGVAATMIVIFSPPLLAGVSAFAGGRALWRALSGPRA